MTYNLRFAGFEEEWNSYFLEDVIKSFVNGQTPSRNVDSYWNGEIPWVSSGELNYNHITSTIEQITEEGKGKANLKLLPAGTFLMAITGLEAAGTRGSCAILDIEATTNQSCMALFPKEDKLTTKFLYYWYLKVGEHYGIKYTQGTKQQSYNKELLEKLPIVIPDNLKEQDKITDCLSLLHFKIELLEKKYKSYVDFKKYLMQQIFAQKLRFDNFDSEWEFKKLGEVSNVKDGTHDSPKYVSNGYPLITSKNLVNGKIDFKNVNYISKEDYDNINKRSNVNKGDILFGMIGTIGNPLIAETDEFAIKNVALIKEKKELVNKFLIHIFETDFINKQFYRLNAGGTQKFIALGLIKDLLVPIPPIEEQLKISEFLSMVDINLNSSKNQISNMKKFKKGLLQQMFI